jgi:hypothetical protein
MRAACRLGLVRWPG